MCRISVLLLPLALCAQNNAPREGTLSLAEALESTLRENPLLRVQGQQAQYSRGVVLGTQSQFDRVIQAGGLQSRGVRANRRLTVRTGIRGAE